jgi:hypothetical protein
MKKKSKLSKKDFDQEFDSGKIAVDFSKGVKTSGLGRLVKIPPMTIPAWMSAEIESMAKLQANTKTSIIRQLLVEGIRSKRAA